MRHHVAIASLVVGLSAWMGAPQSADALLLQFELGNHPNGAVSANPLAVDALDYGLRLDTPTGVNTFGFSNVLMSVDTVTGVATVNGAITHLQSGQPWMLSATFDGIGSTTSPVPYNGMFTDLKAAGIGPGKITYGGGFPGTATTDLSMDLTTGLASPAYTGPRNWIGKVNDDGIALFIAFRHRLSPTFFPGSQWDLLAGAGWLSPVGQSFAATDDFLFVMRDHQSVIPEPLTSALVAMGSLLGFVRTGRARRRRRHGARSAD